MLFKTLDYRELALEQDCFIFTDIHGCLSYFNDAKKLIGINPADKIVLAGDSIDRGENSYLLAQQIRFGEQCETVRGNHEDLVIDEQLDASMRTDALRHANGGEWRCDLNIGILNDLVEYYRTLPVAIEVLLPNNTKIGIVHANIPSGMHWDELKSILLNEDIEKEDLISHLMWERKSVYYDDDFHVGGVDALICGHNIQMDGYKKLGNRYHIDTGFNLMVPGSTKFRATVFQYKNNGPLSGILDAHELYLNEENRLEYIDE